MSANGCDLLKDCVTAVCNENDIVTRCGEHQLRAVITRAGLFKRNLDYRMSQKSVSKLTRKEADLYTPGTMYQVYKG